VSIDLSDPHIHPLQRLLAAPTFHVGQRSVVLVRGSEALHSYELARRRIGMHSDQATANRGTLNTVRAARLDAGRKRTFAFGCS
jgi:hypothetical protein